MKLEFWIILVIFLLGLYFTCKYTKSNIYESFENNLNLPEVKNKPTKSIRELSCPNLLLQKGAKLMLYNTNKIKVPGINPIVFKDLEEYKEFLAWQKSQGIKCPILFLQQTYNAEGDLDYRLRADPLELNGGALPMLLNTDPQILPPIPITPLIDATTDEKPFSNTKRGPQAFDPQGQYIGLYTLIDTKNDNAAFNEANAMSKQYKGFEAADEMAEMIKKAKLKKRN